MLGLPAPYRTPWQYALHIPGVQDNFIIFSEQLDHRIAPIHSDMAIISYVRL